MVCASSSFKFIAGMFVLRMLGFSSSMGIACREWKVPVLRWVLGMESSVDFPAQAVVQGAYAIQEFRALVLIHLQRFGQCLPHVMPLFTIMAFRRSNFWVQASLSCRSVSLYGSCDMLTRRLCSELRHHRQRCDCPRNSVYDCEH